METAHTTVPDIVPNNSAKFHHSTAISLQITVTCSTAHICHIYRPISVTCICWKILECILYNRIVDHLQLSNILNSQQHGSVNCRSTCTNLLESVNDWLLCIQDRLNVAVAYVDFANAVDVVSHKKLFLRLYSYGIRCCILAWLQELFSDRIQCTKVGSVVSEFAALLM